MFSADDTQTTTSSRPSGERPMVSTLTRGVAAARAR